MVEKMIFVAKPLEYVFVRKDMLVTNAMNVIKNTLTFPILLAYVSIQKEYKKK